MSPMKMFEYMASGVPIISSNLPVLKEVLVNGKNAILVSPSNLSEWQKAINLLRTNKNLAKNIAKNAYQLTKESFTWSSRAAKILEILSKKL